jgi:hypothetical protein
MAQVAAGNAAAIDAALPELHATSAGLKSYVTGITAEGMEGKRLSFLLVPFLLSRHSLCLTYLPSECRRACGGHGYSSFAGSLSTLGQKSM